MWAEFYLKTWLKHESYLFVTIGYPILPGMTFPGSNFGGIFFSMVLKNFLIVDETTTPHCFWNVHPNEVEILKESEIESAIFYTWCIFPAMPFHVSFKGYTTPKNIWVWLHSEKVSYECLTGLQPKIWENLSSPQTRGFRVMGKIFPHHTFPHVDSPQEEVFVLPIPLTGTGVIAAWVRMGTTKSSYDGSDLNRPHSSETPCLRDIFTSDLLQRLPRLTEQIDKKKCWKKSLQKKSRGEWKSL